MSDNSNINERLSVLLRLDARYILKNKELTNEYISLHQLIEGYKPSCTGCSAKSRLNAWKQKYSKTNINIQRKEVMSNNTFTLKKGTERLSIPFTGSVITKYSADDLVGYYFAQAKTEQELERRKAFFEVLPKKTQGTDLEVSTLDYMEKFEKQVPNKYKNNIDWINSKIA
tara:strand:- start:87 stop:599 length:513 start_codon:yes stop_codon:yes gene_type:complete